MGLIPSPDAISEEGQAGRAAAVQGWSCASIVGSRGDPRHQVSRYRRRRTTFARLLGRNVLRDHLSGPVEAWTAALNREATGACLMDVRAATRGNTPCPRKQPSTTRRQQNTPHMQLNTTQKLVNTTTPGTTRRRPTMRTPRTGTPPTLDITPKRQLGHIPRSTARSSAAWTRPLSWRPSSAAAGSTGLFRPSV